MNIFPKKIAWKTVVLGIAVLIAVLVPCLTLFQEGDWLSYVLKDSAMHREWLEIGIFAAILVQVCLCIRSRKLLSAVLTGILLIVACLHSMLIPLLLAGLWFAILMLNGSLTEGIAATVVIAGILSLFGQCTPAGVLLVTLSVQTALRLAGVLRAGKPDSSGQKRQTGIRGGITDNSFYGMLRGDASPSRTDRLLLALIVLVILVQIGRANECIDFDSLWYGVRSLQVLTPNGDVFEDLGLVGMAYTYPKGFEILTLPLNMTDSYAVISAFNLFLFTYGLAVTAGIAGRLTSGNGAKPAVLFTVLVPGIVNMTLSAKPDIITWVLQLVMLDRFFEAAVPVSGKGQKSVAANPLSVISVYLLSLTMKPTALIFSTALFGMMFLWTVFSREGRSQLTENSREGRSRLTENSRRGRSFLTETVLSALALAVVWGRTMKLTGMPFTSVFTGALEKLGFTMKYPFSSRSLPSTWQEGSQLMVAVKRVVKMLLMPRGKDMSHVIIAWGGSLIFVLGVLILCNLIIAVIAGNQNRKAKATDRESKQFEIQPGADSAVFKAALTVFIPFIITCFVTLMMLYQVDGNYYMMFYSIVIFLTVISEQRVRENSRLSGTVLLAVLVFQFLIMTMTNWAGVTGFTEIRANSGLYSHRAYYREQLTQTDGSLYDLLAADPGTRVVAFGEHPICLQFPCIVQSYNDITSPWGNVEIVNTADAFIDYLHFAGVDYVYGDAAHLREEAWQWSKGLIDEMTARGILTDFVYEGENWVAKVN